jgi:hypothetical protein
MIPIQVMRVAKSVSDTPCGGQIIMSGETLADIASIKDLMFQASVIFWTIGASINPYSLPPLRPF